jgi:phosphate transport system substrate-binding protein
MRQRRLSMFLGRLHVSPLLVACALCAALIAVSGCASRANGGTARNTIEIAGSDTLVNLALKWAETYMNLHPEVSISVSGGGSGTGIASLINGTIQIADASRQMTVEEVAAAKKNGVTPVEFTVAGDAIAVVINPENRILGLTLSQLSEIYMGSVTSWRTVGGADRPIVLLSRESNSGTYMYFLERVVRMNQKGNNALFSPETLLMPSSQGISVEVRQNPNAIGYDGLGYVTSDQKMVAVAREPGTPYVLPSVRTVQDGSYPIARPLYMYTAGEPTGIIREYLDWILSSGPGEGQSLVQNMGFVPLSREEQ